MLGGDEDDVGLLSAMGIPQAQWEKMRGESVLDIWPENWTAVEVFSAMQTQWRAGMGGVVGLDYTALPVVMDLIGTAANERAECFDGVRVMENEALAHFSRQHGGQ